MIERVIPLTQIQIFDNMCQHSDFSFIDLVDIVAIEDEGMYNKSQLKKLSEVDKKILTIIERIIKLDKGINLDQVKGSEVYLRYYFEDIDYKMKFYFTFISLNSLYKVVQNKVQQDNKLNFSMIDLDDNIQIAHITQLFPMLEMKIRCLGEKKGIFPQKELDTSQISFKDPSSILIHIIVSEVREDRVGFKLCETELFLYLCLYAQNSLNIRNQCIHARDYINGSRLEFGLKVTLFCLLLLIYKKI